MKEEKKEESSFYFYLYRDQAGNAAYKVRQAENGDRVFLVRDKRRHYNEGMPASYYPYRLDAINLSRAETPIFVVGDERDCDKLAELGIVATCGVLDALGGHWPADWGRYFAGRWIVLVPSFATGSDKVAASAIDQLNPIAGHQTLFPPPDRSPGETLADWIDRLEVDKGKLFDMLSAEMNRQLDAERAEDAKHQLPPGFIRGDAWEAPPAAFEEEDSHDLSWKPFPLDLLPGPMREYILEAQRMLGCDPSYFVLPSLVMMAGAIGNSRIITLNEEWPEPSVLWGCVIADSSSMKSPAFKKAIEPLAALDLEFDREYRQKGKAYEAEMDIWKSNTKWREKETPEEVSYSPPKPPVSRRVKVDDITVESLAQIMTANPKGLTLLQDELAAWFSSFTRYKASGGGGSDRPFWLEVFNAAHKRVDRKGGNKPSIVIERAGASVCGTTQKEIFASLMGSDFFTSGFVARILFAMPPRSKKIFVEGGIELAVRESYHNLYRKLFYLDGEACFEEGYAPTPVRLTPAGMAAWKKFHKLWADRQWISFGEQLSALAKLEGYCARFALLFAVSDFVMGVTAEESVDADHIERAVRVVNWFLDEACRVYAMIKKSPETLERERIIKMIEDNSGIVTAHNLFQSNKAKYGSTDRAREVLEHLVLTEVLERVETASGPQGGRRKEYFRLLQHRNGNCATAR